MSTIVSEDEARRLKFEEILNAKIQYLKDKGVSGTAVEFFRNEYIDMYLAGYNQAREIAEEAFDSIKRGLSGLKQ